MTMPPVRYLEKFTHVTGAPSVVFPLYMYQWSPSGRLQAFRSAGVDMGYAYDHLRNAVAPREVAQEDVRFYVAEDTTALADAQIDNLRAACLFIGRGKLWTLGSDGTRRWAYARLRDMPDITIGGVGRNASGDKAPVVMGFDRYSDWFAETLTSISQAVVATPTSFVVNNPGNMPVTLLTIRFRANGAAGFIDPVLLNQTNGYTFASLRDSASANSELRLRTELPAVDYSNDDGASYAADLANYVIPSLQAALSYQLDPGNNTLRYSGGGTPALNIDITFYPTFA